MTVGVIAIPSWDAPDGFADEVVAGLHDTVLRLHADEAVTAVVVRTGDPARGAAAGATGLFARLNVGVERAQPFPGIESLRLLDKPLIAAIEGPCRGAGLEVALLADVRYASDSCVFAFDEAALAPATYYLPRIVGMGPGIELVLTGRSLTCARAVELGLVNRVLPGAALHREATAFAERVGAMPPDLVRFTKRLLLSGLDTPVERHAGYRELARELGVRMRSPYE